MTSRSKINSFSQNNKFFQNKLDIAWLHLTNKCNLNCSWCYVYNKIGHKTAVDISQPLYNLSLQLLKDLHIKELVFIGGEPTLHPNFPQFIYAAKQKGFKSYVVTNGVKLSNLDYLKSLMESGLDFINMSFVAHKAATYNKITRTNNFFDKAVQAVKNMAHLNIPFSLNIIIDQKDKKGCFSSTVSAGTTQLILETKRTNTVHRHRAVAGYQKDKNKYVELLSFVSELGAKEVNLISCEPPSTHSTIDTYNQTKNSLWNNQNKKQVNSALPDPQETAAIMEALYLWNRKNPKLDIHYQAAIPACLFRRDILKDIIEKEKYHPNYIAHLGSGFVINPHGDIHPSSHFVNVKLFNIIKKKRNLTLLTKDEFLKKWNSGKTLNFRKALWRYPSKYCENCPYWEKYCVGGNPFLSFVYDLPRFIQKGYTKNIIKAEIR